MKSVLLVNGTLQPWQKNSHRLIRVYQCDQWAVLLTAISLQSMHRVSSCFTLNAMLLKKRTNISNKIVKVANKKILAELTT